MASTAGARQGIWGSAPFPAAEGEGLRAPPGNGVLRIFGGQPASRKRKRLRRECLIWGLLRPQAPEGHTARTGHSPLSLRMACAVWNGVCTWVLTRVYGEVVQSVNTLTPAKPPRPPPPTPKPHPLRDRGFGVGGGQGFGC